MSLYEYRIIIGTGKDRHNNPISLTRRVDSIDAIEHEAVERFGGCTRYHHVGGWKGPDGLVVEEGVTFSVVLEHHGHLEPLPPRDIVAFAKRAGSILNQQCVLVIGPDGRVHSNLIGIFR